MFKGPEEDEGPRRQREERLATEGGGKADKRGPWEQAH